MFWDELIILKIVTWQISQETAEMQDGISSKTCANNIHERLFKCILRQDFLIK